MSHPVHPGYTTHVHCSLLYMRLAAMLRLVREEEALGYNLEILMILRRIEVSQPPKV